MEESPELIEAVEQVFAACTTPQETWEAAAAITLGLIIADWLLAPPVWRTRWWQFWRPRFRGNRT